MKKHLVCILSCLMMFSLCSCLDTGTEQETKAIASDTTTEKAQKEPETPTIQEQVCFENAGVRVTAKSMVDDSIWGQGVKLLIENNGDKTYSVGVEQLIVNDCMITDFFSSEVAAGKKANDTLYLSSSELETAGIEVVGKIEIYFYLYDSEAWETVYKSECVTLKTSLYDEALTVGNDKGQELYRENGIRIVGQYVKEDALLGASVYLYVENSTDTNITVSCDEMSVNGFMVTPLFSTKVFAGKHAVNDITVLSSELEANEITELKNIELKFRIYNSETFETIANTSAIAFSVE